MGALANMWNAEIKARQAERDGLMAFYLTQVGIEYAKIFVLDNPLFFGLCPGAGGCPSSSDPSGYLWGEGSFRFSVGGVPPFVNRRQLRSVGQRLDSSGNPIARREIGVIVDISIPQTNPGSSYTWREI